MTYRRNGATRGNKRHPELLTAAKLIALFTEGVYSADLERGIVFGRNGRALRPFVGNDEGHLFVRFYAAPGCRGIAVQRIIWMVATGCEIPVGWEIHHRDTNVKNNARSNLVCLHPDDHRLTHGKLMSVNEDAEAVPF